MGRLGGRVVGGLTNSRGPVGWPLGDRPGTVSSKESGPNGTVFSHTLQKGCLLWGREQGVFALFACSTQKAAFIQVTSPFSPWLSLELPVLRGQLFLYKKALQNCFLFKSSASEASQPGRSGAEGELALCCHLVSACEVDAVKRQTFPAGGPGRLPGRFRA